MAFLVENWPRVNSNFFAVNCDKEDRTKIVNNKSLEEEFYMYANNFKEAAHIITQDALDSNRISVLDINFFGLAFLYRHSIELLLKAIGFKYITDKEERKRFINETFHNLYDITEYISSYLNDYIEFDKGGYDWLMKIFEDMNDIDKESDSFRYPFAIVKKNNNEFWGYKEKLDVKVFFNKQTHINLLSFANKMEIAFQILKGYYEEDRKVIHEYKDYSPIFLEEGGEYYAQSVIGYSYNSGKFDCNVTSYKNCADMLYGFMKKDNYNKANLFMPFCYLYRNSIELVMKQILFEESSYNSQKSLKLISENKHKLYAIWKLIKNDIRIHANVNENDVILKNAEEYIVKLNEIDGKSDKFRYPIDKHLNVHFKSVRVFDVENVRDFFEDIFTFLSCVVSMMSSQNDELRAIEYESRNDYY
ncbi:hypothetical protein KPL39_04790 [Clostridium gasigenes]|uniref:hypothetical protein n=1 Tax=Clostridium gasigenes TaxID=94869 RepID=UPI001C0D73C1|nr:hypothetical protein [Clostridium gasigenes]MBU3135580.1 hypothetical protein [Clostridium gasigenes]